MRQHEEEMYPNSTSCRLLQTFSYLFNVTLPCPPIRKHPNGSYVFDDVALNSDHSHISLYIMSILFLLSCFVFALSCRPTTRSSTMQTQ